MIVRQQYLNWVRTLISPALTRLHSDLLVKVDQRSVNQVRDVMIEVLQSATDLVHTLTADNSKEFADHDRIAHVLQSDFFALPMQLGKEARTKTIMD